LSGIRRTIGAAAVRKKAATSDIVLGMVGGKGTSLRELRDRAILLLGFSGAFRRSELVALNLGDIGDCSPAMPRPDCCEDELSAVMARGKSYESARRMKWIPGPETLAGLSPNFGDGRGQAAAA
jgi:hypothetical protein